MFPIVTKNVVSILAISTFVATSVSADTARMRSVDGSVDISGDFVSYENEIYTVETAIGPMLLDANEYHCFGLVCPTSAVGPVEYVISKVSTESKSQFVLVN